MPPETVPSAPDTKPDAFTELEEWIAAGERWLEHATWTLEQANVHLDALDRVFAGIEEDFPGAKERWRLSEARAGDILRRLELALARREKLCAERAERPSFLSVPELAAAIGVSEATARAYLERDLIPGARKADPNLKRSRWIIPADAPARYLSERGA